MNQKFSHRANDIGISQSIQMSAVIEDLKSQGKKIYGLNIGETLFKTPDPIKHGTLKALEENKTQYSAVQGVRELREELADWYNCKNQSHISFENVLIGVGSKHILYSLFQILLNPGDEVLVPAPYWVTIPESIKLASGVPIYIETQNGKIDIDSLKDYLSPKTKVLFINFPNNPTGATLSLEDQKKLINFAEENGIWLISDEAYESILFDDEVFKSTFSISNSLKVISVQSFSKTFCMTGFRIGMCFASSEVISMMNKLHGHLTGNICTFIQYGAIEALIMPSSYMENFLKEMTRNRDMAYELTKEIFPLTERPKGAFYLFPNIENFLSDDIKSAYELAFYILKEANVAVLPSEFFGASGHLRISFAGHYEDIKEGLTKIKNLLKRNL